MELLLYNLSQVEMFFFWNPIMHFKLTMDHTKNLILLKIEAIKLAFLNHDFLQYYKVSTFNS